MDIPRRPPAQTAMMVHCVAAVGDVVAYVNLLSLTVEGLNRVPDSSTQGRPSDSATAPPG